MAPTRYEDGGEGKEPSVCEAPSQWPSFGSGLSAPDLDQDTGLETCSLSISESYLFLTVGPHEPGHGTALPFATSGAGNTPTPPRVTSECCGEDELKKVLSPVNCCKFTVSLVGSLPRRLLWGSQRLSSAGEGQCQQGQLEETPVSSQVDVLQPAVTGPCPDKRHRLCPKRAGRGSYQTYQLPFETHLEIMDHNNWQLESR